VLYEAYNIAAEVQDKDGHLPLHLACIHGAPPPVAKMLFQAYQKAAEVQDKHRNLPLHLSCASEFVSIDLLNLLLWAYPKSIEMQDENGESPLEILRNTLHRLNFDSPTNICSELDVGQISSSEMALAIEETKHDECIKFKMACLVKKHKILHFSMKKMVQGVHIIHPARNQSYHCFRLHRNPHYGIKIKYVPLFKWIVKTMGIPFQEYKASEGEHKNDFLTIINNLPDHTLILQQIYDAVKSRKLRSRNLSNFFISYGFSALYCKAGGPPLLTTSIDSESSEKIQILPILMPLLSKLSESLKAHYSHIAPDFDRNQQYSQLMGSNFNYRLCEINYYEGVDCAIIFSGNLLAPHCDVMNDWRRGYDFLSVTKTLIWDAEIKRSVTLSIICYTRKAVGDYIYGAQKDIR
jgi:hypothetical protein